MNFQILFEFCQFYMDEWHRIPPVKLDGLHNIKLPRVFKAQIAECQMRVSRPHQHEKEEKKVINESPWANIKHAGLVPFTKVSSKERARERGFLTCVWSERIKKRVSVQVP